MKKEIVELKLKADNTAFLIKQIEILEESIRNIAEKKRHYYECNKEFGAELFTSYDFAELGSELSQINSQIEQYESQIKGL